MAAQDPEEEEAWVDADEMWEQDWSLLKVPGSLAKDVAKEPASTSENVPARAAAEFLDSATQRMWLSRGEQPLKPPEDVPVVEDLSLEDPFADSDGTAPAEVPESLAKDVAKEPASISEDVPARAAAEVLDSATQEDVAEQPAKPPEGKQRWGRFRAKKATRNKIPQFLRYHGIYMESMEAARPEPEQQELLNTFPAAFMQVFGCHLMELQTRNCEEANIEAAIACGGVDALLKVFDYYADVSTVQERSCVAAAALASKSADIRTMFIEGRLIQRIVNIMTGHRGSEGLQKLACVVLLSLADHSVWCRSEMVHSNCLEAVCAALKEHPVGETDLQAQALLLLSKLAADGADVRIRLAWADGILLTMRAILEAVDLEAQRAGCNLLESWGADGPRYSEQILDGELFCRMLRHVGQPELQKLLRLSLQWLRQQDWRVSRGLSAGDQKKHRLSGNKIDEARLFES